MGTFLSIRTRVSTLVIDLPAAVQAAVPALVNAAMRKIQVKHNFKVMEAEALYTTALSTRILGAVPTDMKEIAQEPFYTEFNYPGQFRRITLTANRHGTVGAFGAQDVGRPMVLLDAIPLVDGSRNYEIYPLPDGLSDYSDGQYRITVPYFRYLPALAADGDTNWFTVYAEEYIVNQATARAFAMDWDEEHLAVWSKLAEEERGEVILQDKRFRLAGVNEFVPLWRGARSPTLRW